MISDEFEIFELKSNETNEMISVFYLIKHTSIYTYVGSSTKH